MDQSNTTTASHSHVFLGPEHAKSESRTWSVIWICSAMMVAEIVGGLLFGSIALVADGLHMSTHAGALLLAALAYTYARKHADNPVFTFGTGKLGDLAVFTSAIILAMIALLIGYESVSRFFAPVSINFEEAIPIAVLGLCVNIASAWLLSGGHHHGHSHGAHGHGGHGHEHGPDVHDHHDHGVDHDEVRYITTQSRMVRLEIFEDGVPPRFHVRVEDGAWLPAASVIIETVRDDGQVQLFPMKERKDFLASVDAIPEPHAFKANVVIDGTNYPVTFEEHEHAHEAAHVHAQGSTHADNNMRAAVVHVIADAAVSVLVIIGLLLARVFGWLWMDPLAGIVGAVVIASWAFGLIRDTGAILLDMNPDRAMTAKVREAIEGDGDQLSDLHLWRLGPGHLGAVLSVLTSEATRGQAYYREKLSRFRSLSHLTIEVVHQG